MDSYACFLEAWQVGEGDYLRMRDELFEGETVDSLFQDILRTEQTQRAISDPS